jgi:DNA-binding transcriptional MerR regulator
MAMEHIGRQHAADSDMLPTYFVNPRPVNMNETEEQIVEILTSCPRTNVPWTEPMSAVAKKMKWSTEKTVAYVEHLMYRKIVVLKTEDLHKAAAQENKGQFWWEGGKTRRSHSDLPQASRFYSSADVARIASVSLRQLQWWDERKVVSPRHEGRKRTYLPQDVVEITVIAELRRKGFSLQKIRRVLRFLQREMGKHLGDLFSSASNLHLLTDGKSIFLEDQQDRIIDLLKNARQPMFLVCVSDQVRRLEPTLRKSVRSELPW